MFNEYISASARVSAAEVGEPVLMIEKLPRQFHVATKTVPHMPRDFNRAHRDVDNFLYGAGPLQTKTKQEVYQRYRRGESVQALAQRFNQPQPRIDRIINEMRVARITELPLHSMGNEPLARLCSQKKEAEILGPLPESDLVQTKPHVPSGLPAYFASLYEVPLLTREQEAHLFWKMNYLKYKAGRLRDELDRDRPKSCLMDQIENLYDESVAIKNQIIRANLRLVVSIAKRYVTPGNDLFELVSDGNLSLIRAVEKFDVSRGTMFCTYATVAILNTFAHSTTAALRHRRRFLTSPAEILCDIETSGTEPYGEGSLQLWRESYVKQVLRCLNERELKIITGRFGLSRHRKPLTLKQLGAVMGVSIERIRQIQCRALGKLRKVVEDNRIDFDTALAGQAGNQPRQHGPHQWRTAPRGELY